MNVADSEVVASVMKMAGYEPTDNEAEADAIFLNTCSVRENAENKIYHRLDQLHALQHAAGSEGGIRPILGVLGCMAERVKDDLVQNHHANLVCGPDAYLSLPEMMAAVEVGQPAVDVHWRQPRERFCEHHARLQQLLPLLHCAFHPWKGAVARR